MSPKKGGGIDPLDIVDQQLEIFQRLSLKGELSYNAIQSLERLAKLKVVLEMKRNKGSDDGDLDGVSDEELLKAIRELSSE